MQLSNKQENEEVKQQVIELYELETKFKTIKQQYEEKKTKVTTAIKNFMYCNKGMNDEFQFLAQKGNTFSGMNKMLRVKRIVPTSIEWDADKLSEKLPKAVAVKVIKKQHTIDDWNGLVKYLKSCGVNPRKFKSYITTSSVVDSKALEQLDAVGELSMKDVKGCYRVVEKSGYLRLDIMEDDG